MEKNEKNLLVIGIVIVLALVFFGGYGIMGFSGGRIDGYYGLGFLFTIVALVCAIWVIYDVLVNNRGLSDGMKVLWVLLAIFFSIITAIIYFLIGRNSNNDLFKTRRASR